MLLDREDFCNKSHQELSIRGNPFKNVRKPPVKTSVRESLPCNDYYVTDTLLSSRQIRLNMV